MMGTLYADGFSDISIINDVVRIDLFRLQPDRSGSGAAVKQEPEGTLALPLRGLLSGLELLDRVRQDLAARDAAAARPAAVNAPDAGGAVVTPLPASRLPNPPTPASRDESDRSVNFP